MAKAVKTLTFVIAVLLTISCSKPETPFPTILPSTKFVSSTEVITTTPSITSLTLTPEPFSQTPIGASSTPPVRSTPTIILDTNHDLSLVYNTPNQVTDGKLSMSVEDNQTCYKPGEIIYLRITYQNMTNNMLTLVDYKLISNKTAMKANGQIYPLLTTTDNKIIYPESLYMPYLGIDPDSPLLQPIPPKASFNVLGKYSLPKEIRTEDSDKNVTIGFLRSGLYFLKLVYIASEYQGSWAGAISSNQIEICVVE